MILKNRNTTGYFKLDNYCVQRTDMSVEAKGTLAYLMSLPSDWQIRATHTAKALGVGRDKLRRIFQELASFRYLVQVAKRGESGRIVDWDYVVSDEPIPTGDGKFGGFTVVSEGVTYTQDDQVTENPSAGKSAVQVTEKPPVGQPGTTKERELQIKDQKKELRTNVVSPTGESDTPPRQVVSGPVSLKAVHLEPPKSNIESILAAGLANKPKPKPKSNEPDFEPFFDAWNELAPDLPSVTDRGRRGLQQVKNKLKGLIREFGQEEALSIFEDGCREVNLDDFWKEKRYSIDNLARHAVSKAEKWTSRKHQPQDSGLPAGMDPNSAEATAWLLSNSDLDGRRKPDRRNTERRNQ